MIYSLELARMAAKLIDFSRVNEIVVIWVENCCRGVAAENVDVCMNVLLNSIIRNISILKWAAQEEPRRSRELFFFLD